MVSNKKPSLQIGCEGFFMVPRDRIELPTRGFSDTSLEFPNLLKLHNLLLKQKI